MTDAGRIGFVAKGDWSENEKYERLDVVYNGDYAWIARQDSKGIEPNDNNKEFWMRMVSKTAVEKATTENNGVVHPDGTTISIDEDGMIYLPIDNSTLYVGEDGILKAKIPAADGTTIEDTDGTFSVPTASAEKKGVVKLDGETIVNVRGAITVPIDKDTIYIDEDGVIRAKQVATDGETVVFNSDNKLSVPTATAENLGVVKVDGETIKIDDDGTIHGSSTVDIDGETIVENEDGKLSVPTATAETLGVVKGEYDGYLGTKNLAPRLTNGAYYMDGAISANLGGTTKVCLTEWVEVEPSASYTISANSSKQIQMTASGIATWGENRRDIVGGWKSFNGAEVLNIPSDVHYLMLLFKATDDSAISASEITDFQIEKGAVKTDYVAPINSNKSIDDVKVNKLVVADEYSAKENLTSGALRVWSEDSQLYKAKLNITQPTDNPILPNNATYFERTSVANEISKINSNLSDIGQVLDSGSFDQNTVIPNKVWTELTKGQLKLTTGTWLIFLDWGMYNSINQAKYGRIVVDGVTIATQQINAQLCQSTCISVMKVEDGSSGIVKAWAYSTDGTATSYGYRLRACKFSN